MPDRSHQADRDPPSARPARDRNADTSPEHPLHTLQRQAGNAAVARSLAQGRPEILLTRRDRDHDTTADEDDEPRSSRSGGGTSRSRSGSDSGSRRRTNSDTSRDTSRGTSRGTRRTRSHTRDDDEVQPKREASQAGPEVGAAGGPLSPTTSRQIAGRQGAGSPLDGATRARMEHALDADLGDVRVHTDAESAALTRRLGARAFAVGRDIFFARPSGVRDTRLLAHELAHVLQQRRGSPPAGALAVAPADDAREREADAVAEQVERDDQRA